MGFCSPPVMRATPMRSADAIARFVPRNVPFYRRT